MQLKLFVVAVPALFTCFATWSAIPVSTPTPITPTEEREPAPVYHPHFRKNLECRISNDLTITIRYQTVTFDAEGAKKMKPGQSWHLAGATIETTSEVIIGGKTIAAGTYALSVQKAEEGRWGLTLHEGKGFSLPKDGAHVLNTEFKNDAPLFEHMNIDVQPAGDKTHTKLHLDVHFDRLLASSTIEVPNKEK